MKHITFALIALFLVGYGVLAQESERQVSPAAMAARIALEEEQLRQSQRDVRICSGELTKAVEDQALRIGRAKLDAAGKAMGCTTGVDWAKNPPECLPMAVLGPGTRPAKP